MANGLGAKTKKAGRPRQIGLHADIHELAGALIVVDEGWVQTSHGNLSLTILGPRFRGSEKSGAQSPLSTQAADAAKFPLPNGNS